MVRKILTFVTAVFALVVFMFLGNLVVGLTDQIGAKDRSKLGSLVKQKNVGDDISSIVINEVVVHVDVAETPADRAQGLMNVSYMPPDRGMLFIFPDESIHSFWMKDTLISLDIIWINEANEVVHIESNVPTCNLLACPRYKNDVPAKYVLEVNSGWAELNNVALNDEVKIR
jgi:uncharacterized membrane protein (UPF0127 family)